MKRQIVFLLPLLVLATLPNAGLAQQPEKRAERIERYIQDRTAFITRELELNPAESQAFFPIYNELQHRKFELNATLHRKIRKTLKERKATDEEFLEWVNALDSIPVREAELTRQYETRFRDLLSPEKLFQLKITERKFARKSLAPSKPRSEAGAPARAK